MRISAVLTLFLLTYLFDICDKYAIGHQLDYNATKSFALYFKLKHIKFDLPDFVFGKHVIPVVDKCKYLRITVREANCDNDLKRQMREYYANVNMLLQKFSNCSPDVKCCMFNSYCATMYCSSIWFGSTVTSMKKLKIANTNGLRRLLNMPKYYSAFEMFVKLNIPSFKFVFSFKTPIIKSDNSFMIGKRMVTSTILLFSLIRPWWNDILDTHT